MKVSLLRHLTPSRKKVPALTERSLYSEHSSLADLSAERSTFRGWALQGRTRLGAASLCSCNQKSKEKFQEKVFFPSSNGEHGLELRG